MSSANNSKLNLHFLSFVSESLENLVVDVNEKEFGSMTWSRK